VTAFDYQAVSSYYGKLHAVIRQSNVLHHFIFNDTAKVWDFQSVDAQSAKLPTLTEYNGELFLAMLNGNKVFFSTWSAKSNTWAPNKPVNNEFLWGVPAMFVRNSQLFIVFFQKIIQGGRYFTFPTIRNSKPDDD
jgi:hypothetical protein